MSRGKADSIQDVTAPTAAAVTALLEAPERERRAAEDREATAARARAQGKLREGLEQRLAVMTEISTEVERWFAARPVVTAAVFEETVGDHAREWIDRVVLLGRELVDTTGSLAQTAPRRWLAALAEPVPAEAFHAAVACLRELEEKEPVARQRVATWRTQRATTAEQLRRAIQQTHHQAEWLEDAPRV